jgi:predicted nucleotidyltransferase
MGQKTSLDHLTERERQVVREFITKVRQRFDGLLVSAVLYGSRARGKAARDSDMDVLVVLSDTDSEVRKEVRHLAVEVWLEHDIYLSTRVWSQTHWRKSQDLETLLYSGIRRDGINLLALTPAAD